MNTQEFPLDLQRTGYSYVERPNTVILALLERHVLADRPDARILDIGCGAGANARALRDRHPGARVTGVEPDAHAASLAREACESVFTGTSDAWLATRPEGRFDAVVLSDVLEHVPDPVGFLRTLVAFPGVADATFIVSIPNYAVWYNRLRTAAGRFDYAWSGLYDRTHLRFFTRRSIKDLLRYVGLAVIEDRCTPSIVQSAAPVLRKFFERDVKQGDHLSLPKSPAYQLYEKIVEPAERRVCGLWPSLLGFQIVSAARRQRIS